MHLSNTRGHLLLDTPHRQLRSPSTDRAGSLHNPRLREESAVIREAHNTNHRRVSIIPYISASSLSMPRFGGASLPHGACPRLVLFLFLFFFSFFFLYSFVFVFFSRLSYPLPPASFADNEDFLSEPLGLIDDRFS